MGVGLGARKILGGFMKRIISFIPLLILIIAGCESPMDTTPADEYFPLKVGNKWYYNSIYPDTTYINVIWEVNGKEEINGKQYFKIVEQNLQINHIDTLFYRFDEDTLFCKRINYDERIVADFSLNLNDTAYWQNDLRVVQKTENIIKFETPFGADYGYSISFKKGIGITNTIQNGFVYNRLTLIKAEIK